MTDSRLVITMNEWERRGPDDDPRLRHLRELNASEQALTQKLRRKLKITELRSGLEIRSLSHVGRIRLGVVDIRIRPKLQQATLLNLLRYAFGFRRLCLFESVSASLEAGGFEDLLVYQLNAEAAELIGHGLHRDYQLQGAALSSPRGRVDLSRLVQQSGVIRAELPCQFYSRVADCDMNRLLLAGLRLAAGVTSDPDLQWHARRLAEELTDVGVSPIRLDSMALSRVRRGMNRLTVAYEAAFKLIELLLTSQGITHDPTLASVDLPGFLFDMNRFFQALLSRFLHDYLPSRYSVHDETTLRNVISYAPGFGRYGWRPPRLRPDFVVMTGNETVAVLDAKYRDLGKQRLPRDMLYQVAIYAAVQKTREAVILYPTTDSEAPEVRLELRHPQAGAFLAQVCLRPVVLPELDRLLPARSNAANERRCRTLAWQLPFGHQ